MLTVSLFLFRELDPGLQEAVSTLIWAAPRLQSEVAELKIVRMISDFTIHLLIDLHVSLCFGFIFFVSQVSDQLCAKYSKEYGKLCRTNQIGTVNDRV